MLIATGRISPAGLELAFINAGCACYSCPACPGGSQPLHVRFTPINCGCPRPSVVSIMSDYPLIVATFPQQTGQSLDHSPDKVLGGPWESSVPIAGGGSPGAPVTGVCSGLPFRTLRKPAARHDRGGGFSPGAWEMAVDKACFPARVLSASPFLGGQKHKTHPVRTWPSPHQLGLTGQY